MLRTTLDCTIQKQIIKSSQCECIIRSISDAYKLNSRLT